MAETFTDKIKLSKRDTGDLNWGQGANANLDALDSHMQQATLRPPRTITVTLGSGAVGANLSGNTSYFYKVTAINAAGETTEGLIPATVEGQVVEPATPLPVIIQWETAKGATGYRIYKSTASGQEKFLASVSGEATSTYTDNGNTATNPSISVPAANTACVMGSNEQVIFNDAGVPSGNDKLKFTKASGQLALTGRIKIVDGQQANGKVLMSDADGLAAWQAAPAGVTDHGALTGLSDDDHPQYAKKAGDTFTGGVNVEGDVGIGVDSPAAKLQVMVANIIGAPSYQGFGLNDLVGAQGQYTGSIPTTITIEMRAPTTPNMFNWEIASGPSGTEVPITGDWQPLGDSGIEIKFTNTTGHNGSERWTIALTPSNTAIKTNGAVIGASFTGNGAGLTGVAATDPTKLPLSGGTMTGTLRMGENCITISGNRSIAGGVNEFDSDWGLGASGGYGGRIELRGPYAGPIMRIGDPNERGHNFISTPLSVGHNGAPAAGAGLDVNGSVKIADGNQGAGKVLTSDSNGLATWQTPAGGGGYATTVVPAPTGVAATDTANIQTALNAKGVYVGGSTVVLREGTYLINATLNIPDNTVLKGQGMNATIIKADTSLGAVPLISHIGNGDRIEIRDLKINGSQSTRGAVASHDISISGRLARLERISMVGHTASTGAYSAIRLVCGSSSVGGSIIRDCEFQVTGDMGAQGPACGSGYISSNALLVQGCVFRAYSGDITLIHGSPGTNNNGRVAIIGNEFHLLAANITYLIKMLTGIVAHNRFYRESGTTTESVSTAGITATNISVTGNVALNSGNGAINAYGSLITVTGNVGFSSYTGGTPVNNV